MTKKQEFNPPSWKIYKTHPHSINDLIEGLSGISDPELGYTIIQLGLIRDIEILDEHALVNMILTTPYCPYGPSMMESARKKVEQILKMPTEIEYGSEVWDPAMMEEGLMDDEWGLFG